MWALKICMQIDKRGIIFRNNSTHMELYGRKLRHDLRQNRARFNCMSIVYVTRQYNWLVLFLYLQPIHFAFSDVNGHTVIFHSFIHMFRLPHRAKHWSVIFISNHWRTLHSDKLWLLIYTVKSQLPDLHLRIKVKYVLKILYNNLLKHSSITMSTLQIYFLFSILQ